MAEVTATMFLIMRTGPLLILMGITIKIHMLIVIIQILHMQITRFKFKEEEDIDNRG
jgi:hypothetical protein